MVTVDISDARVSDRPDDLLVTYALGSCIAVMVHDPVRIAAGMIHYMLPASELSPEKAQARPAMFADTGVPALLESLHRLGCERRNLVVKVAGGGTLHDDRGLFAIGRRNYLAVRRLLSEAGIRVAAEDVGGARSRTARLHVGTGRCTVLSQGQEVEL
jgi:chemotaxis protein CheD